MFFAEPEATALVNGSISMRTATSSKTPDLTATPEPAALRESVEAPYKPYRLTSRTLPNSAVNDLRGHFASS
jgi:hypothetical protein